jgi:hypothetical protein
MLSALKVICHRDGEGWPLLTVETEVNGYSKRTNDRDPSLLDSLDSYKGSRDFFPAFAALVSLVQNTAFFTVY